MNGRERFLSVFEGQTPDRPPVWIMRQAGRYLPEYRALKEKHSFTEMVRTPELAAEVTLQPLRRFNLDAAILFSDILIIPEALGQPYHFREAGGIGMDFTLRQPADLDRLDGSGVAQALAYFAEGLRKVKQHLKGEKALLAFGGSPWTLAVYMVEGGSSRNFQQIKSLAYGHPAAFEQLMEMLVDALTSLFQMSLDAGADAIQIFDSWGALCPARDYERLSLSWIRRLISRFPPSTRFIVYSRGMGHHYAQLTATGARALGLDWTVDLAALSRRVSAQTVLQGNLDPTLLGTTPELTRHHAQQLLDSMRNKPGYIFNLGHGILPDAKIANVEALIQTIEEYPECLEN